MTRILTPDTVVHNHRRVPPEWQELLAVSRRVLDSGHEPQKVVPQLIMAVDALPGEQLDANRYYGLGQFFCGIAHAWKDPADQARLARRASAALARQHTSYMQGYTRMTGRTLPKRPHSLYLNEVSGSGMTSRSSARFVRHTYQQLLSDERLLLSALSTVAEARCPERAPTLSRLPQPAATYARRVLRGTDAFTSVHSNLFTGSAMVLRACLERRYLLHTAKPRENPALHTFITDDELLALDALHISADVASLRFDEAQSFDWYANPTWSGPLALTRDKIPRQLPPFLGKTARNDPVGLLHKARLACPVLHITRMLPTIVSTMPQILVEANQRIDAAARR